MRGGNRKRLIFLAGAIALCLCLHGCVKRSPRTDNPDNQKQARKEEPQKRCGLICRIQRAGDDRDGKAEGPVQETPPTRPAAVRPQGKGVYHTVKKGQTLWRICHAYGADLTEVARANGISDPTSIKVGQKIWIPGAERTIDVPPAPGLGGTGPVVSRSGVPPNPRASRGTLASPVAGGIITSTFGMRNGTAHEGLDFSAPVGTPVLAADDGKVVYSDDSIRGYGNMIIIKHAGNLTTVYAHNRVNLVKTGQLVKKGQKIAEVGQTGRVNAKGGVCHFEVRVGEKPVNPKYYLP